MKKPIIAGITVIACVALCAAVWPRSVQVEELPAEPGINATSAETEARLEETPHIFISADTPVSETEPVAESEPEVIGISAEKETEKPVTTRAAQAVKPTASSSELYNGVVRVVDGEKQIYLLGFGWIKDEGDGSVGTMVGNPGDQLTGHKVGIMGGGTPVDGKGDINKQVGIMGGGTVAEDMYESGVKIGIMGGDDSAPHETTLPPEQPEPTGNVIYVELQPPVTKANTPPAYKPNGEPYNP